MVEILPDDAPAPRLCHLIKWPDFDGYGFNLHAERSNPGQFIGKIDVQSPAQMAGLREGDRIIEVNGVNISNENHRQVVERIKSNPQEAKLLVVDQEADLWYREQDIVVKSSQINVVYIRTPVPRPEPDSPRATKFHNQQQRSQKANQPQENGGSDGSSGSTNGDKQQQRQEKPADSSDGHQRQEQQQSSMTTNQSLDASDFNDDSMEHDKQQASTVELPGRPSRASPPMSPDSGRGDEEQSSSPLAGPDKTLTVEAEINHRRPLAEDQSIKLKEEEEQRETNQDEDAPNHKLEPPSEDLMDEKERIRKLHNKSADSGKSSSPDAISNSSNTSGSHSDLVAASGAETSADAQRGDTNEQRLIGREASDTAPSLDSNLLEASNDKKSEQTSESIWKPANATTTITTQARKTEQTPEQDRKTEDTQVNNNNNKMNLEDSHGKEGRQANAMTNIKTSSHYQKQALESSGNCINNNNSCSGLNLNMTASQMRELIASRKKFDPKKAQMNIRQKYEIIQQM